MAAPRRQGSSSPGPASPRPGTDGVSLAPPSKIPGRPSYLGPVASFPRSASDAVPENRVPVQAEGGRTPVVAVRSPTRRRGDSADSASVRHSLNNRGNERTGEAACAALHRRVSVHHRQDKRGGDEATGK
ncbi:hypothetical protein EYF80_058652 [Liparis tanakae]|uniref:Uncharacterized protein n=1 Tax=Liparis tanakae TaxID=230148 RepID=A0A4Z2EQK7_9TELE|nr:hypothetical protein EYF80_058652 [Liparis tanakae]